MEIFQLLLNMSMFCGALSIVLTFCIIYKHLLFFSMPHLQSKIIGILWMIPIYSFNSILSLIFPTSAVYIDNARDCYEAYVLYLFFALLLAFLVKDNEANMIEYLESIPPISPAFPFNLCTNTVYTGKNYLRYIKFGTLQYCLVRPSVALFGFMLSYVGLYETGNYNPLGNAYPLLTLCLNLSVCLSFASLLSFYYTFREELQPFQPVPKFLCIKILIFCIFWQSLLISFLCHFEVLSPPPGADYSKESFSAVLQNMCICVEMLGAAIGHWHAFNYRPFVYNESLGMCDMAAACRSTGFLGSPLLAMEERGKLASYKDLCPPPAHRSRLPHALSSGKNPRRSSRGSDGAGPFSSSGLAAGEYSPLGMVEQADEEGREGGGADPSTAQVSHGQSQARDKKTSVAVKMGLRLHGLTSIAMARNQNDRKRGGGETASALRNAVDSNFAHSSAVRDFNESMPMVVLPSGFTPSCGTVVSSDPRDRVARGRQKSRAQKDRGCGDEDN